MARTKHVSGCQMVIVERRSHIELMAQDGLHGHPNRVQMKAKLWEISLGKTDESDLLGEAWKADRVLPIYSCCRAPHRMVLALPYHRLGSPDNSSMHRMHRQSNKPYESNKTHEPCPTDYGLGPTKPRSSHAGSQCWIAGFDPAWIPKG